MKRLLFLIAFMVLIAQSSCVGTRKLNYVRESLAAMKETDSTEEKEIYGLKNISEKKIREGKIDSLNGGRIRKKIFSYEGEAAYYRKKADSLAVLLTDKAAFRKQYRKTVLPALAMLRDYYKRSKERISLYLIIEDGLNIANYHQYDLAAFFGPGKYTIPPEMAGSAEASFEPLIDSLVLFANKYSGKKRTVSLVILGFADGTGFSNTSPLTAALKQLMGTNGASREEMNRKLSELRAEEICKQLVALYYKRSAAFADRENLKIEYNYQGKGEVYPQPNIKDYVTDDPRRRIVLCYWLVLPD
ncbi:MAG: hypothetical protein U0U70_03305 [Chitinophagaceae bacterium]